MVRMCASLWLSRARSASTALAQTAVAGSVRDETGGALPGVLVEAHADAGRSRSRRRPTRAGAYRLDA